MTCITFEIVVDASASGKTGVLTVVPGDVLVALEPAPEHRLTAVLTG